MGKIAKRKSKRRKNPGDGLVSTATSAAVGFAGYAGTRFFARMIYSQVVKRFPKAAKHAHVAASAAGAAGVYVGTRYVERAQEYHEAATIGAGIALLQSAIQTYLPDKFAYVTADVDGRLSANAPEKNKTMVAPPPASELDLNQLLLENPELEADEIGQADPVQTEDEIDFDLSFPN